MKTFFLCASLIALCSIGSLVYAENEEKNFSIGPSISYFSPRSTEIKDVFGSGINYDIMAKMKLNSQVSLVGSVSYFAKDKSDSSNMSVDVPAPASTRSNMEIQQVGIFDSQSFEEIDYQSIPVMMNLMVAVPAPSKKWDVNVGGGAGFVLTSVKAKTTSVNSFTISSVDTSAPPAEQQLVELANGSDSVTKSYSKSDNPFGMQMMANVNFKLTPTVALTSNARYLTAHSATNKFDTDLGGFSIGGGVKIAF